MNRRFPPSPPSACVSVSATCKKRAVAESSCHRLCVSHETIRGRSSGAASRTPARAIPSRGEDPHPRATERATDEQLVGVGQGGCVVEHVNMHMYMCMCMCMHMWPMSSHLLVHTLPCIARPPVDSAVRKRLVRRQQAAHPLRVGGHLGLRLCWLWLELGSGRLPLKLEGVQQRTKDLGSWGATNGGNRG